MTKQELLQNIRAKNPQYSNLTDEALLYFATKQKPEFKKIVGDVSLPKTQKQEPKKEVAATQQTDVTQRHPLGDGAIGFLKSFGRTLTDVYDTASFLTRNPISNAIESQARKTSIGNAIVSKGNELEDKLMNKPIERAKEALQSTNNAQKYGGYAGTVAQFVLPATWAAKGIKIASNIKKSLSMNTQELAKLSPGKFKKIFNMEKSELDKVGGKFKEQVFKMPDKVKQLTDEFSDVLQGNVTDNLKNAQKLGKNLWKKTLDLFEGNNPSFNLNQIKTYLENQIPKKVPFSSSDEKINYSKKAVDEFLALIKKGDLKSLEEARAKFRYVGSDASGKLKSSYEVIHNAIKDVVKSNLPEEKRMLYDAYKTKMAKLFDVREILKAKNSVLKKVPTIKKIGSTIKKAAVAGGAYLGIKSIVD